MSRLFEIGNFAVLPFWALMILAPRARLTVRVMSSPWVVLAPVALYGVVVLPDVLRILPLVARPQLDGVAGLLGEHTGATAAWMHFLAFDLWVGRYIFLRERAAREPEARPLPAIALSLLLVLTLLLGPLGLFAYLLLRSGFGARIGGLWAKSLESSKQLSVLGLLSLLTAALTTLLPLLDARQLNGSSVWLKPTKFGVSIAIAAFTLSFLLSAINMPAVSRKRLVTTITWLTGLELVLITGQAARGVGSHFNMTTLGDAAVFQIMGIAITIVTIAVARLGVYALRTEYEDRALGSGIRFGILIMVLGSCVAFAMPRPSPAQLESLRDGRTPTTIGAHTVGAEDSDGQGIPLTRWSTAGGDLRVPHFVGLHALQLLPLIGLVLGRRLRTRPLLAEQLTRIASLGYLGVFAVFLVQALRAQPVLAPDAITLGMLASVIGACAIASAAVLAKQTLAAPSSLNAVA